MIIRDIYQKLKDNLKNDYILLLIGARQTGKTYLLKQLQKELKKDQVTVNFFTFEDPLFLSEINNHPENIFHFITKGKKLILLLDEIQYLNNPSNFLKYIYDSYQKTIKIIATGSSAFYLDQKFKDSLAGRKRIFEIQTLNFSEFIRAKKLDYYLEKIQSNYLVSKQKRSWLIPEKQHLSQLFTEYTLYGGYPRVVLAEDLEEKQNTLRELYFSFLKKDFFEAGIKNETKMYQLLNILAAQAGSLINLQELANTLNIAHQTIENYCYVLEKSFIIKRISPFSQNLRKELTKMPKYYFFDLGLRNIILNDFKQISERLDSGAFLENIFCRILLDLNVANIQFWRTQNKNEVDFIVNKELAFEVKLRKQNFSLNKYQIFKSSYPDLPLKLVTWEDQIELDMLDFI